jgi:adenine-specific DNA-methyltransferase
LLADIEGLDEQTNGLLIKSENLQAINLLTRTFSSNVRGCYIDPPFNLGENADYLYRVDYKDSTWLTLLYDRVLGIKKLLMDDGSIFVRCSHDGNMILRQLLNQTYGQDNYRNEIVLRRAEETKGDLNKQFGTIKSITVNYDNLYWYSKYPNSRFSKIIKPISAEKSDAHWHSFWKALDRPTMRYEILGIDLSNHYGQWMWEKNRAFAAVKNYEIYQEQFEPKGISLEDYWVQTGKSLEFVKRDGDKIGSIKYWIPPRTETMADTNWLDIKGYANKWGFKTENSEGVLKRVIDSLSEKDDYIIDCFLGSGTTAAVALKLQRKFIGIDMGDHISKIA